MSANVANNVAQGKVQDYVKKSHNIEGNEVKSEKITKDVQKNCLSLTEQWKRGELEQGYYYTKYNPKVGKPFVEIELRNYLLDLAKVRDADTVEILAPVPSFEELQVLNEDIDTITELWKQERSQLNEKIQLIGKLSVQVVDLKEENQKLKELLKDLIDEAEGALQAIQKDCESDDWSVFHYPEVQYFYTLKDKIDEVLNVAKD